MGRNVILLDLDGVLITTPPWKPDEMHEDGYSDFNPLCVSNFNILLEKATADIWLTSSRRWTKTLIEFQEIFKNRKVIKSPVGRIPDGTGGRSRLSEINAFLDHEPYQHYMIIDDDNSLQSLTPSRKTHWIKTNPLIGFNNECLLSSIEIISKWE